MIVHDQNPKNFIIAWDDVNGCPVGAQNSDIPSTERSGSFFWAILYYYFISMILYFTIGIAVKYVKYGERSFPALLPHNKFWEDVLERIIVLVHLHRNLLLRFLLVSVVEISTLPCHKYRVFQIWVFSK